MQRVTWRTVGPVIALLAWAAAIANFISQAAHWQSAWLDVTIYREAAASLLDGVDVYTRAYGFAGDGLPFTYPPFALLVLVPLALVPLSVAIGLVLLLNAAALSICVRWAGDYALGPGRTPWWLAVALAAAVAVLIEPMRATIGLGQINLVLLALILGLDAVGTRWRGVGAGIGAAIKVTPALLVVAQLVRRDRRAFLRGVAAFAAGTALAALLEWPDTRTYFGGLLWQSDRPGDLSYVGNQSLRGLWERLLPGAATPVWLISCALVLLLAGYAVSRHRSDAWAALTAAGVAGLLVSPVSWSHHWVWLLPAVAVAVRYRRESPALVLVSAVWVLGALLMFQPRFPELMGSLSLYVSCGVAWLVALAVLRPARPVSLPGVRTVTSTAMRRRPRIPS